MTCGCKAYAFPHRPKGGKCFSAFYGPFCGDCGKPCQAEASDEGHGSYEFWGRTGVHRDIVVSSDCCGADVYSDASLTEDYKPEPYDDY